MLGNGYELDAIAAVILGVEPASLVVYSGTLFGAWSLDLNGLTLLNMCPYFLTDWSSKGLVIIVAVMPIDRLTAGASGR